MTDRELDGLTVASAVDLIRRRALSPVELTQAVLERIARTQPSMKSFITVTAQLAEKQSRQREKALSGQASRGILFGVPLSLKDLYDTKGVPTTAGSRVFAERMPRVDSTVTRRLYRSGMVLVGKTNMHEMAFGVTNINPHYGTARNPWDADRICGGSSGGSAAAVAMSLGLASMGSDTGGSIRIPAALCGVVGLKPTYGRVSLHGAMPLSWSLDHPGPIARTVEDTALMLEAVAGFDPRDPYSRRKPAPRYRDALSQSIRGLRVGIPRTYFFDRIAPEVDGATRTAVRVLEKLGAQTVEIDLPAAVHQRAIFSQIASAEAYAVHEESLATMGDQYGPDVRNRIEAGRLLLSVDYVRAQRARAVLKEQCRRAFEIADVILTPTVPLQAPKIEETSVRWGSDTEAIGSALTRFTRPFNITGLPAISVPSGFTPQGLPLAIQIVGRPFDESTVLKAAHAYEQETRWFERRPQILQVS